MYLLSSLILVLITQGNTMFTTWEMRHRHRNFLFLIKFIVIAKLIFILMIVNCRVFKSR